MQTTPRLNLHSASFPLLSQHGGRTVIYRDSGDMSPYGSPPDQRWQIIPQTLYLHNVFPTNQGLQSVGIADTIPAAVPATIAFDQIFILRDYKENKILFSPAGGACYVLDGNTLVWRSVAVPELAGFTGMVTRAYLHAKTYIFFEHTGCYTLSFRGDMLERKELVGLDSTLIKGICAANNYLIAFTDDTVFWSSSIDELDFTPSLSTGAGSEKPNAVKGQITTCLPIADGFIIYTSGNAIAALYSGNQSFPWVFREIPGSAGVLSPEHVSYEANVANHYAWSTSGFQEVTKTAATLTFPEVTDFLAGKVLEDFISSALVVSTFTDPLRIKVTFVGTRFLSISYGVTSLTHVLVYDFVLKRWGKIKYNHVDVFEYVEPKPFRYTRWIDLVGSWLDQYPQTWRDYTHIEISNSIPNRSFGLLTETGKIVTLEMDTETQISPGVLYDSVLQIGKIQFSRGSFAELLSIDVEIIKAAGSLKILSTLDGKNPTRSTVPSVLVNTQNNTGYGCRTTGVNHILEFSGIFNLCSLECSGINNGLVK